MIKDEDGIPSAIIEPGTRLKESKIIGDEDVRIHFFLKLDNGFCCAPAMDQPSSNIKTRYIYLKFNGSYNLLKLAIIPVLR